MKNFKIIITMIVLILAGQAMAQGIIDDPPPDMPPFGDGPRHEQMKERIETIKVWKLTESLDLTTEQSQQFFPVYNKFREDHKAIDDERRQTMRELNRLLDTDNPGDKDIVKILDKLDSFESRIQTLRSKFRNDLTAILTTKQIGRLYVFEMQFRSQMREIIQDARKGMRNGRFQREP